MATIRIPIDIVNQDSGVASDIVGNQIAAGTAPSVTNQPCFVLADGGSDEGVYCEFEIPQNYVGSPVLVVQGILDGTPSSGDDLAFGFRKRAVAVNEVAAGTFDAEQTAQDLDISGYASTDLYEEEITLTAGDYAAGDKVFGYAFIDASGTTYAGNFLLTGLYFKYADA